MSKRELSHHEDTELRLGIPGSNCNEVNKQSLVARRTNKRAFSNTNEETSNPSMRKFHDHDLDLDLSPPTKVQAIGWPPVKSYRKNYLQVKKTQAEVTNIYVKISMNGAPYLRNIDLRIYKGYKELLKILEHMFKLKVDELSNRRSDTNNNGSEYEPTYKDKDGDWMLVGDVPWELFISSCKRLRIMKRSETKGLGCLS